MLMFEFNKDVSKHPIHDYQNGERAHPLARGSWDCGKEIPHPDYNAFKGGGDPCSRLCINYITCRIVLNNIL